MGHPAEVLGKLLRDSINGPAAVIVFFVISGFCIHWPHRTAGRIGLDYFVRRYVRIGVPLCAALLISPNLGIPAADLVKSVLWSLYCELAYYSIYPLLARLARGIGWRALTSVAFVVPFLWAVVWPSHFGNYTEGLLHNVVFGLPCWLMGCLLAERQSSGTRTSGDIWLWRGAAFLASVATLELRFHTPVHFDLSLNFFGILVFYWLSRELDYYQTRTPWSWLERAGAWSYSLYVMHPAAGQVTAKLFSSWSLGAQWLVRIPMTLGICYLFYLVVEKPSHRLARLAGRALRPPVALGVPPFA
jgi:peptidoglycan/LPS O-acetylase OafA/YrhL